MKSDARLLVDAANEVLAGEMDNWNKKDSERLAMVTESLKGRTVLVILTPEEASALHGVVGNGWGDGDYEDWLGGPARAKTCVRAMEKLEKARRLGPPPRRHAGTNGRAR
jgi:hypothetical protein